VDYTKQLYLGNEPKEELMLPIRNRMFVKAHGGLWTSTFHSNTSEWVEWCESQDFWTTDVRTGWLLTPNPDVRVLKIDSVDDLIKCVERYGIENEDLGGFLTLLDFEKMSQDYDGMWLTSKGQWQTRFSRPSLYSWDVESTHWFRWVFDKVEYYGIVGGEKKYREED
jgi:hypothetical protein